MPITAHTALSTNASTGLSECNVATLASSSHTAQTVILSQKQHTQHKLYAHLHRVSPESRPVKKFLSPREHQPATQSTYWDTYQQTANPDSTRNLHAHSGITICTHRILPTQCSVQPNHVNCKWLLTVLPSIDNILTHQETVHNEPG